LAGLGRLYEDLHEVNRGLARRLRSAVSQDAVVNAVVLLGIYTSLLPEALDDLLEELRPAFAALLQQFSRAAVIQRPPDGSWSGCEPVPDDSVPTRLISRHRAG
ncbi:MAG TPA: hypothetical protein VLT59_00005, partial [Steroidobacteraceae bacterium]|nr:hypothetical protein [Steroidobacteraceae bacterium]